MSSLARNRGEKNKTFLSANYIRRAPTYHLMSPLTSSENNTSLPID